MPNATHGPRHQRTCCSPCVARLEGEHARGPMANLSSSAFTCRAQRQPRRASGFAPLPVCATPRTLSGFSIRHTAGPCYHPRVAAQTTEAHSGFRVAQLRPETPFSTLPQDHRSVRCAYTCTVIRTLLYAHAVTRSRDSRVKEPTEKRPERYQ